MTASVVLLTFTFEDHPRALFSPAVTEVKPASEIRPENMLSPSPTFGRIRPQITKISAVAPPAIYVFTMRQWARID